MFWIDSTYFQTFHFLYQLRIRALLSLSCSIVVLVLWQGLGISLSFSLSSSIIIYKNLGDRKPLQVYRMLYSLYNGLTLLHKYTSTEYQQADPNPCDTVTCDTACIVDRLSLPDWTLNFLLTTVSPNSLVSCFYYLNVHVFLSTFLCSPCLSFAGITTVIYIYIYIYTIKLISN